MRQSTPTPPLHLSWLPACLLAGLLALSLTAPAAAQQRSYNFTPSELSGADVQSPTSLQFGPDGRLYVSQQNGRIRVLSVEREDANDYQVTSTETINLVKDIPNYDDDGDLNTREINRQITGIYVTGTAAQPVLYVGSSDPRIGAGGGGSDLGLDTNSGVISKLTCTGGRSEEACQEWEIVHLVRGLPRSEENHSNNGLQLDEEAEVMYVAHGGHTNGGAPSNNFAELTEYALSAAILEIDLAAIEAMPTKTDAEGQRYKYDLPTLNDPTRTNEASGGDPGDPFGGNDGLNQARLVAGGPVQIYSPGFRNPYDLVLTESGRLYVVDNGPNGQWGGYPQYEESSMCTNAYLEDEPGSTTPGPDPATYPDSVALLEGSDGAPDTKVNNMDNLHYVSEEGYYGGHPTPVRANPTGAGLFANGTYRDGSAATPDLPADWPAVPEALANPVECDYRQPGVDDGALYTWNHSTNGLTEYTASNFDGGLQGNLLAAGYTDEGIIHRVELNSDGDATTNVSGFASSFGSKPLDVVAQGDSALFGGTVWAATHGGNGVSVFEPADYNGRDVPVCTGVNDETIDEDGDQYSNADELDNGTNPCSAASQPADLDGTLASNGFKDSDLADPDDDDDGLADTQDPFALDSENGTETVVPVRYELFNGEPGTGIGGVGFTGLMANGSNYQALLDPDDDLIIGGTSGLFTDPTVGAGNAEGGDNDQVNALQFGVNVSESTGPFTVKAQLNGRFFGRPSSGSQSQGIYLGTGDQDHYLKVAVNGDGGFDVYYEEGQEEVAGMQTYEGPEGLLDAGSLTLYLSVMPSAGTVQPKYAVGGGSVETLGLPIALQGDVLSAVRGAYRFNDTASALAVGIIATAGAGGETFGATWDNIDVIEDPVTDGTWDYFADFDETRHENAFVEAGDKFYLLGGRESRTVKIYDPENETWSDGADSPIQLHHFQAIGHNGLIYVVGAFTGDYPDEDPVENVYIYDTEADVWFEGPENPTGPGGGRPRGSGGAVFYKGQIYFAGGNVNGHVGPASRAFDVYDPATGTWEALPDMPRARDHFAAVVSGNRLYAIGGRLSNRGEDGDVFDDVIAEVDVYDFSSGEWSTLPSEKNLPTPRAAAATGLLGNEIVVAGGESDQNSAHAETEAFDLEDQSWRALSDMRTPRHATQAVVSGGALYVAGGSPNQGGPGQASLPLEGLYFGEHTPPDGTPITASTLVASDSLALGGAAMGSNARGVAQLRNTEGNQALIVEDVSLSGSGDLALQDAPTSPVVIAPGASLDIAVAFTPSSESGAEGTLSVTHSGGELIEIPVSAEYDPSAGVRSVEVSVTKGWNLMHLPVAVDDSSATAVYSALSLIDGPIARENGSLQQVSYLTRGQAYWMRFSQSGTQVVEGREIQKVTHNLEPGWNLVSGPSCTVGLSSVDDADNILINGTLNAYTNGTYEVVSSLTPGKGYWIRARDAGTVTFDCGSTPAALASRTAAPSTRRAGGADFNRESFDRLIVRDAVGRQQVLYFGSELGGARSLESFSSPPPPPAGGFDARIVPEAFDETHPEEGHRLTEDAEALVHVQATRRPLTVTVEASDQGQMPEERQLAATNASSSTAASEVRYVLEELSNGQVVATHELASQEPFELGTSENTTTLRVRRQSAVVPDAFALQGNHPNPFRERTAIALKLPERAHVTVEVYDMLGRQVRTLEQTMPAGAQQELRLQGDGLSSGVYLYRVVATMAESGETRIGTGRMVLMR